MEAKMSKERRRAFKTLLETKKTIPVPGAYDAVSAKILESLGFDAVYATGFGIAASRVGVPDIGLLTMTEVLDQTRNINHAISLPLIVDIDTGYGGLGNVYRTMRSFEEAGVAAVQIEDQTFPKKCGGLPGRSIAPVEEMIATIGVAKEAREDDNLVIIARTDAVSSMGVAEGKSRLSAYLEAGADLVHVGEHCPVRDLKDIAKSMDNRLVVAGLTSDWEESHLPFSEYEEWGVKIVIYPLFALLVAVKAINNAYNEFMEKNYLTQTRATQLSSEFWEFQELLGLQHWNDREARHQPGE
tara:strand:+ start:59 stop:955 length:897 start_codon:yes stop_codon:yes gene_type:complete